MVGRRLFDFVDGPNGWNEDMGYGARHAGTPPMFVVTHHVPPVRVSPSATHLTYRLETG